MYNAIYKFKITDEGIWEADFDIKFDQIDNPFDDRLPAPEGRKGPFYAQDYSRIQANTAKRARKLAKTTWSDEEGRSGQDFSDLLNEEFALNATVDFSFEHKYQGTGDWSNSDKYVVTLDEKAAKRDTSKELTLPQKKSVAGVEIKSISLDSIKRIERPKPLLP